MAGLAHGTPTWDCCPSTFLVSQTLNWSGDGGLTDSPLLTMLASLGLALSCLSHSVLGQSRQPNIIFILADDLGWNDVSWHNKEMPTTRMEALAEEGVILEQAYSQQVCTPSRAALLTGRYPFTIGRQKGGRG